MIAYILTKEVNAYDQFSEYFIEAFPVQPSANLLMSYGVPESAVQHVLAGGGRQDVEEEWFFLRRLDLDDSIGEGE